MNLRLAPVAAIAMALAVVSGCSSSSPDASQPPRLTISELLGQPQYDQDNYQDMEARIQDLIATCMAEEGWEYIPTQYPDEFDTYSAEDERARREREGYGIAYWILNSGGDSGIVDPGIDWVDPNTAIVDAMTDAEREAYYESLFGSQETVIYEEDAATTDMVIDPSPGDWSQTDRGCQGEASDVVYGVTVDPDEDYWNAVNRFYEDLNERVLADPRITALNSQWGQCMQDAGFDYQVPNDIWETAYVELQARADEIVGPDFYADPMADWTQQQVEDFFATATEEEIEALFNTQRELTDEQRTGLEALLADEIDLALAEYDCSKPTQEESTEIYSQIEEEYATEHRAEIEALVAGGGQ